MKNFNDIEHEDIAKEADILSEESVDLAAEAEILEEKAQALKDAAEELQEEAAAAEGFEGTEAEAAAAAGEGADAEGLLSKEAELLAEEAELLSEEARTLGEEAELLTEEAVELNQEIEELEEKPVKQNRWTGVTTAVVIIAAVLVLGLLGFMGYREGWFDALKPKVKSVCEIGDYSKIEVLSSAVNVTDDTVDAYISSLLEDYPGQELTDEWCASYASDVLGRDDITDIDGFRTYIHDYIYEHFLHSAMIEYLKSITTVKSYDEDVLAKLMEYSDTGLTYYASMYGMDKASLVSAYGYASVEEYETEEAHSYMDTIMMLDKIMKDKKLSYTQEDVDADMQRYININGLADTYTLEDFKEQSGETWCYLYENLQFKTDFIMKAIEDNVVIVDDDQAE